MINSNRIVPITNIDLITMYSVALSTLEAAPEKLAATTQGIFSQNTNNKVVMCDEPVKSFNFGSSASAGTVYFVAAPDYEGFKVQTIKVSTAGTTVKPDSRTLYKAVRASGTITVSQVGL